MSTYSEMEADVAADLIGELSALIRSLGIVSVLGALSDACGGAAGARALDLVWAGGDQESRKTSLHDFDLLTFAHRRILEAADAVEEYGAIYSKFPK